MRSVLCAMIIFFFFFFFGKEISLFVLTNNYLLEEYIFFNAIIPS